MFKNIYDIRTWLSITIIVFMLQMSAVTVSASATSSASVITLTNSERTGQGVPALSQNSKLVSAATAKAQHMCTHDYWAHIAPDGTTGWDFMAASGYRYVMAGENLAHGYATGTAVVQAWMESPGHRDNLLSPDFTEIGIGMASCRNTEIVVALYGSRSVTESFQSDDENVSQQPGATASIPPLTDEINSAVKNSNTDFHNELQEPQMQSEPETTFVVDILEKLLQILRNNYTHNSDLSECHLLPEVFCQPQS